MAIAFVAAADLGNNGGATNSLTAAYTVGSGSDRLLVVVAVGDVANGADDVTGVTYATVAMTRGSVEVTTGSVYLTRFVYTYYLLNPAAGSNNVVISCTSNHFLIAVAADYTGVKQSGQPDATANNVHISSIITQLTTSITTTQDNSWAVLGSSGYGGDLPPTAGTGTILRISGAVYGTPGLFDSNGVITPAQAFSMTTNQPGSTQGMRHAITSFSPTQPPLPSDRTLSIVQSNMRW